MSITRLDRIDTVEKNVKEESRKLYNKNNTKEIGISIVKRDGEDIESMIRRFKKKVIKSGIIKDCKRRDYYEKPSVARRRKSNEAQKRLEREAEKEMKENSKKKRTGEKYEKN